MAIDELEFARESLRRAVLRWGNQTVPALTEQAEDKEHDENFTILMEVLLLQTFPMEELREYRDLVTARAETIASEKES